jgi:hypothetical protein
MRDTIAGCQAAFSLASSLAEAVILTRVGVIGETDDEGVNNFLTFTKRVALFRIVNGVVYTFATPVVAKMQTRFLFLSAVRSLIDLIISLARLGWWDSFKGDQ